MVESLQALLDDVFAVLEELLLLRELCEYSDFVHLVVFLGLREPSLFVLDQLVISDLDLFDAAFLFLYFFFQS